MANTFGISAMLEQVGTIEPAVPGPTMSARRTASFSDGGGGGVDKPHLFYEVMWVCTGYHVNLLTLERKWFCGVGDTFEIAWQDWLRKDPF